MGTKRELKQDNLKKLGEAYVLALANGTLKPKTPKDAWEDR